MARMRIQRWSTNEGVRYSLAEASGSPELCRGDPFEGLRRTGEAVPPSAALLAPLEPRTIYAIGLNYRAHAEEMNQPLPEHPVVTMKSASAAHPPEKPIQLPRFLRSDMADFEAELAVVIGRACRNAAASDALDHVLGYAAANDVSARDWQKNDSGGQWVRGKTFDTFCPLGPALVSPESIPAPNRLALGAELNGETMQASNTSDMIFSVAELIAFLSGSTTLMPGTVILTGTPPGVGTARTPPRYLQPGDRVAIEIEGVGRLENPVEEEPVEPA